MSKEFKSEGNKNQFVISNESLCRKGNKSMSFSGEAKLRSRKLPVALIQTMPADTVSKTCDDHDNFACGHWLHELYFAPEDREAVGLSQGESWTIWSPEFMEFMGKKVIEREDKQGE